MMRSLYSGVAGLRAHQTKMDVIGNNIANVNTVGFKSSSVTFSDVYYQTIQSATGANATTGTAGQNAMQVGLGVSVASVVASVTETGPTQSTGNALDIAIDGNSFFIVNVNGVNYFTRDGSFGVDGNGTLCTSSGASVMGWQVDPNDETQIIKTTVSKLNIMSSENLYSEPEATTNAYITGNIDMNDTQIKSDSEGQAVTFEFYDNLGQSYTAILNIKQSGTATNEYTISVSDITDEDGDSIFVSESTDEDGNVTYDESSITEFSFGGVDYKATVAADGTLTLTTSDDLPVLEFNGSTGKFVSVGEEEGESLELSITASPNPFETVDVGFSSLTMFSDGGDSTLAGYKGASSSDSTGSGRQVGNMTGISIDSSGKIYGSYDNGDSKLLGQIAVASFSNPSGLESVGGNLFAETQNSGDFNGIGQDVTSDGGSFSTGNLEMSNVDLAEQFTEMITTQRGFQANSRIITTSDTMLEELINLKR